MVQENYTSWAAIIKKYFTDECNHWEIPHYSLINFVTKFRCLKPVNITVLVTKMDTVCQVLTKWYSVVIH